MKHPQQVKRSPFFIRKVSTLPVALATYTFVFVGRLKAIFQAGNGFSRYSLCLPTEVIYNTCFTEGSPLKLSAAISIASSFCISGLMEPLTASANMVCRFFRRIITYAVVWFLKNTDYLYLFDGINFSR